MLQDYFSTVMLSLITFFSFFTRIPIKRKKKNTGKFMQTMMEYHRCVCVRPGA